MNIQNLQIHPTRFLMRMVKKMLRYGYEINY